MKLEAQWGTKFARILALVLLLVGSLSCAREVESSRPASFPEQTDVDRAKHLVDDKGVPFLKIAGIGEQRHPAWVALYALAYAGVETYDSNLAIPENSEKFDACLTWLEQNLKQKAEGRWLWEYGFDSTYNDISIKAPWSSAFAQATGIQAFLAAYKRTANDKYLALAKKAAQLLFVPLEQGGFLFQSGSDIWFEEIPRPIENPSHILNGHMRVLLALKELADASGDAAIASWLKRGTDTLYRWLPRYDTGYWLRYDLNPRKKDLLFRFANPYGFANHSLAVDRITLRDPLSNQEIVLDIGAKGDAEGANRIAGTHWGQIEQLSGRTARKLIPAGLESKPDEMAAPHSYFYLTLPGEWKDNLRDQWYEMDIEYYDDAAANITVQQRAVSPGPTFREMRDGDLHLTGGSQWRRWVIPLRPSDLGYWVGSSYAIKHKQYLERLSVLDSRFQSWAILATGYAKGSQVAISKSSEVKLRTALFPKQTPMLPVYSMDKDGVLLQHIASSKSRFLPDGMYDPKSDRGVGRYSPFQVANQLIEGSSISGGSYSILNREGIKKLPALRWFLDPKNRVAAAGSTTYVFDFPNVYNDVSTTPPWTSAFSQAYVIKALSKAKVDFSNFELDDLIKSVASSYGVPINKGGVASYDRSGFSFFEEVPNGTHVLNAHLVSISELANIASELKLADIQALAFSGVNTLRERLHLFDTGYWLRYDQNPKKELLLQLDWFAGNDSPLIDEVLLQNPQTGRFVRVDVGHLGDFEGATRISGNEWQAEQIIDGKSVRSFINGYRKHIQPVPGGGRHNVFLVLNIPEREFSNFFDVPVHLLVLRYKDVAAGNFGVKIQTISDGQSLKFVPLRNGILRTNGDQQWKEAVFSIRPQDLGWYKGPDYQVYEVEQLRRIANHTGDWFFSQYADRHGYFMEVHKAGRSAIIEPINTSAKPSPKIAITQETPTYPGHGFANALDGDPSDDYVAGIENEKESVVVISLEPAAAPTELRITWESSANFAKSVKVYGVADGSEDQMLIGEVRAKDGQLKRIPLNVTKNINRIKISFSQFSGQPRLLLRLLEIN